MNYHSDMGNSSLEWNKADVMHAMSLGVLATSSRATAWLFLVKASDSRNLFGEAG